MSSLPKRRQRPRMRVREPDRVTSPGHCKWVRSRYHCAVVDNPNGKLCEGPIQAHHVQTRGAGGGDDQVVPLCMIHHEEVHRGRETFAKRYAIDLERMARDLWMADTYHRRKYEADKAVARMAGLNTEETHD